MKIAIVYDWIDKWGGVERVLLTLHEMFPQATFYTSYFDEKEAPWAKNLEIKTSFIQKLPSFIKKNRLLSFFLYPYAFESFNFSGYDLVISVSSSFAKSVITRPETYHVCYLLTPPRYIWIEPDTYLTGIKKLGRFFLPRIKQWDFVAAQRPDKIISISKEVAKRCKKFYKRDSEVIYPPFDIEYWEKLKTQSSNVKTKTQNSKLTKKYFLIVSRLEPYKRVDLVVQLFKHLNIQLVIVGKGSEERQLKADAKDNISFLSDISDEELAILYKNAQALIMPQAEDFGYVALEAQFFSCPIIAYKKGGASETVVDGKTGIFFDAQTTHSLRIALERYSKLQESLIQTLIQPQKAKVLSSSKKNFIEKMQLIVEIVTEK